jgi:hypothetical protein
LLVVSKAALWIAVMRSSHILSFFLSLRPNIGVELRERYQFPQSKMKEGESDHSQKTAFCLPVIGFEIILIFIFGLQRKVEDIAGLLNISSRSR